MHMPVDKIKRGIAVNKASEAVKTHMASILGIMNMSGRGMCNNDINSTCTPDFKSQSADFFTHLVLGILMRFAIVPMAALKPQYS